MALFELVAAASSSAWAASTGGVGTAELESEIARDPAVGLDVAASLLESHVAPCYETARVVAACIAEKSAVLLVEREEEMGRQDAILQRIITMSCSTRESAALRILLRCCATLCCLAPHPLSQPAESSAIGRRVSLTVDALQRCAHSDAIALFFEQLPVAHAWNHRARSQDAMDMCVGVMQWLAAATRAPPGTHVSRKDLFGCMTSWVRSDSMRCALVQPGEVSTMAPGRCGRDDGHIGARFTLDDLAAHPLIFLAFERIAHSDDTEEFTEEEEDAAELILELIDNIPEVTTTRMWLTPRTDGSIAGGFLADIAARAPLNRLVGEIVFKLAETVHVHVRSGATASTGSSTTLAMLGLVARAAAGWEVSTTVESQRNSPHVRASSSSSSSSSSLAPLLGMSVIYDYFAGRIVGTLNDASGNTPSDMQSYLRCLMEWLPGLVQHIRRVCVMNSSQWSGDHREADVDHETLIGGRGEDTDGGSVLDVASEVLVSVITFSLGGVAHVCEGTTSSLSSHEIASAITVFNDWMVCDLNDAVAMLTANSSVASSWTSPPDGSHGPWNHATESGMSWSYMDILLTLLHNIGEETICGVRDIANMHVKGVVGRALMGTLTSACHISCALRRGLDVRWSSPSTEGMRTRVLYSSHRTLAKFAPFIAMCTVDAESDTNYDDTSSKLPRTTTWHDLMRETILTCFGAVDAAICQCTMMPDGVAQCTRPSGRCMSSCVHESLRTIEVIVENMAVSSMSTPITGKKTQLFVGNLLNVSKQSLSMLSKGVSARVAQDGTTCVSMPSILFDIERRLSRCVFVLLTMCADEYTMHQSSNHIEPMTMQRLMEQVNELVLGNFAATIRAYANLQHEPEQQQQQDVGGGNCCSSLHHPGHPPPSTLREYEWRCFSSLVRTVALLESPLMETFSSSCHQGDSSSSFHPRGGAPGDNGAGITACDEVVRAMLVHPFENVKALLMLLIRNSDERHAPAWKDDIGNTINLSLMSLVLATRMIVLCVTNYEHVIARLQSSTSGEQSISTTHGGVENPSVLWQLLVFSSSDVGSDCAPCTLSPCVLDIVACVANSLTVAHNVGAYADQLLCIVDTASHTILAKHNAHAAIGVSWILSFCELVRVIFSGQVVGTGAASNVSACTALVERVVTILTTILVTMQCQGTGARQGVSAVSHTTATTTTIGVMKMDRLEPSVAALKALRAIIECESLWWWNAGGSRKQNLGSEGTTAFGGANDGEAHLVALRDGAGQAVTMSIISAFVHARRGAAKMCDMQVLYKAADAVLAMCQFPFTRCPVEQGPSANACDRVLFWIERSLNACGIDTSMDATEQTAIRVDLSEWRSALHDGVNSSSNGGAAHRMSSHLKSRVLRRVFKRFCDQCT